MKEFAAVLAVGIVASFAAVTNVHAAEGTGTATAEVLTPITIGNSTQDLNFGQFGPGSGGSVTIAADGTRTSAGVVVVSASTKSAASFAVTGADNATYAITLPASATITSGANSMTVNGFGSNPSDTGTLSGTVEQTLFVGATVNVGATQAAGSYSGTFTVTVEYN